HDFNNLLTAIQGYTELLLERFGHDEEARSDLREIARASDRASSLTGQLLAFSRRQVLETEVLDLNSVVEELENMLRRLIGEHVRLVTRLTPGIDRIEADRGQLEQVILNLALNARDAMPRGGRLLIETAQVEVDEAHRSRRPSLAPGRYVMLAVSDTGRGMDRETREHLFEPFFTTKDPGEGTGLGLATVHGIVHQSGGQIFVYSEPGEGSTFKVYLPGTDRDRPVAPEEEASADAGRGSETILVCEDDDSVRRLVVEVLSQRGYEVLAAATGREAAAMEADHGGSVDLLLSDVVLPDLRGPELEDRLRGNRPQLRVLFISGYTDGAVRMRTDWAEGRAFLQKPFTPSSLVARVREVLDEAASPSGS
ncbi:MAG: ATP-binding protein, partial [Thermoanaerobaculia bacterium]|nr:ATP-binding protein [Thermoanaerobaculia bacterium]